VPEANRYLWGFVTLPSWRGRGIYPRLLQAILLQEAGDAERFWIVHQLANTASARGIAKAGFHLAGKLYFLREGGIGVTPVGAPDRGSAGADLLGLPILKG
jgi:hypothetical protein